MIKGIQTSFKIAMYSKISPKFDGLLISPNWPLSKYSIISNRNPLNTYNLDFQETRVENSVNPRDPACATF